MHLGMVVFMHGSGMCWSPDDLEVRRIIQTHLLVVVGCHDPSAASPWVEDLYGICDTIVIGRHPHTAHHSFIQPFGQCVSSPIVRYIQS